jgi:hypothetical protein
MTNLSKQIILNKLILPKELVDIIKDYTFHRIKRIPKTDERYKLLLSIPCKEYDEEDDVTYVYMSISQDKDYFLTYRMFEIQLQTLIYNGNAIHSIAGQSFMIE